MKQLRREHKRIWSYSVVNNSFIYRDMFRLCMRGALNRNHFYTWFYLDKKLKHAVVYLIDYVIQCKGVK